MSIQAVGSGAGLNQIGPATQTFYDATLIDALHPELRIAQYADVRDIPLKEGQTISWRTFAALSAAASALTEGSPPAGSNLTVTEVSTTIAQYGDFVEMTDHLIDSGPDPYWLKTIELQGRQAALTFDSLIQTEILGGTAVIYAGNAVSRVTVDAADLILEVDLDDAIETLRNNHVPFVTEWIPAMMETATVPGAPAYIGFVTPTTWKRIKKLTDVDKAETYSGAETRFPGEVGKYDSIRFIETTTGLVFAGAGAGAIDVHAVAIVGPGSYAISRLTGRELTAHRRVPGSDPVPGDELAQKGHTGWKTSFTTKRLDESKIVRIETAA